MSAAVGRESLPDLTSCVEIPAQTENQNLDAVELDLYRFYDLQRVEEARCDRDAFNKLLDEYIGFIRLKASCFFLPDGTRDDLMQEGMIGFFKAVRDYNGERASFKSFMELCVQRQIITAIKTSTRRKHASLNNSISLDQPVGENVNDGEVTLAEALPDRGPTPEEALIAQETFAKLSDIISFELSWVENQCLMMAAEGLKYKTIADELCIDEKSVDNALQRVKRKLAAYL